MRGRGREALDVLPAAPEHDADRLAPWAVDRASLVYWGLGRADEAERILTDVPPDAPGQDLLAATRSWIQLHDGRTQRALATAAAVLARGDAGAPAVVAAATSGAIAAGLAGRIGLANQVYRQGKASLAAGAVPWPEGGAQVDYGICQALRVAGRLPEAGHVADRGYRRAMARDAVATAGLWAGLRGTIAKAQGRPQRARATLLEAICLLDGVDGYRQRQMWCAELAGACALLGDAGGARTWFARADALRNGSNRVHEPSIELNRAWLYWAEGRLDKAADQAGRAARLAAAAEQLTVEAVALYDLARLGRPRSVLVRLRELADTVECGFVRVLSSAVHALVSDDALALQRAATGFVHHGWTLHAAEAVSAAVVAFQRRGQGALARPVWEVRAAYLAECDAVTTPLLDIDGVVVALTRREREVARLAVGLPSKEVAARLGLSVHTVNNTLARAYTKLGVGNRHELATVISVAAGSRPPHCARD